MTSQQSTDRTNRRSGDSSSVNSVGHRTRPGAMARLVMLGLGVLGVAGLGGVVGVGGAAGCTRNLETGDRILNFLTFEDERSLGEQAAPGLTQEFGGATRSPALQAYIREVGMRLVSQVRDTRYRDGLAWEFTLLDSEVINAFALPGGKIFISRGLLARMTNEAQLAGVLGHEVGHVTAQHSARRVSQAMVAGGIIQGVAAAVGGDDGGASELLPALNVAGTLVIMKFGRDEESQADSLGLAYMTGAGYNPVGMLQLMQILKEASEGEGGHPPEWMSTHPLPDTRIRRIAGELAGPYAQAYTDPARRIGEEEFRRRALEPLRRLPPPTQRAQREAEALMRLARVHSCAGCAGSADGACVRGGGGSSAR
jgi:predicted Zn-dependent protease